MIDLFSTYLFDAVAVSGPVEVLIDHEMHSDLGLVLRALYY